MKKVSGLEQAVFVLYLKRVLFEGSIRGHYK